jgi:hypothetical protein
MKRSLVLLGTLVLCGSLAGCATDPRDDAINSIVQLMNDSASEVTSISKKVQEAVDKHQKENVPLDFSEAIKATKNLEKFGKEAQDRKAKIIDLIKTPETDEQKKDYAERFAGPINGAFSSLVKAKTTLNETLTKAEAISEDAKAKVQELRTKIREAEGPFETIARQQG